MEFLAFSNVSDTLSAIVLALVFTAPAALALHKIYLTQYHGRMPAKHRRHYQKQAIKLIKSTNSPEQAKYFLETLKNA